MDPRAWKRFRRNRGAIAGAVLVAFVVGIAAVGPWLAPFDPNQQFAEALDATLGVPVEPNAKFKLGADAVGRDELSRLLHGGRVSMQVALVATALAILLGVSVGVVSGYFGGLTDSIAMRAVDVLLSMPFLLVAIALNKVVLSPSLWTLCALLGLLSWTTLARVTRTKTMQVRELEYVQAARALGMSTTRVVLRHVLPNVLGPAIVIGTTLVAQMIITESAMSFLGLGVQPPQASWGSMLQDAQQMMTYAPRLLVYPGAMIVLAVFGFNLLGEGLRDALDPKD